MSDYKFDFCYFINTNQTSTVTGWPIDVFIQNRGPMYTLYTKIASTDLQLN